MAAYPSPANSILQRPFTAFFLLSLQGYSLAASFIAEELVSNDDYCIDTFEKGNVAQSQLQ